MAATTPLPQPSNSTAFFFPQSEIIVDEKTPAGDPSPAKGRLFEN